MRATVPAHSKPVCGEHFFFEIGSPIGQGPSTAGADTSTTHDAPDRPTNPLCREDPSRSATRAFIAAVPEGSRGTPPRGGFVSGSTQPNRVRREPTAFNPESPYNPPPLDRVHHLSDDHNTKFSPCP